MTIKPTGVGSTGPADKASATNNIAAQLGAAAVKTIGGYLKDALAGTNGNTGSLVAMAENTGIGKNLSTAFVS